jgi:hypothetical protein
MTHVPKSEPTFTAIVQSLLHARTPIHHIPRLVYLMDWKSAIEDGRQATHVIWTVDAIGDIDFDPVSKEIDTIRSAMRGLKGMAASVLLLNQDTMIPASARPAYDHVVREAGILRLVPLMVLVNSTFPCMTSGGDQALDLPALALKYREVVPA